MFVCVCVKRTRFFKLWVRPRKKFDLWVGEDSFLWLWWRWWRPCHNSFCRRRRRCRRPCGVVSISSGCTNSGFMDVSSPSFFFCRSHVGVRVAAAALSFNHHRHTVVGPHTGSSALAVRRMSAIRHDTDDTFLKARTHRWLYSEHVSSPDLIYTMPWFKYYLQHNICILTIANI